MNNNLIENYNKITNSTINNFSFIREGLDFYYITISLDDKSEITLNQYKEGDDKTAYNGIIEAIELFADTSVKTFTYDRFDYVI